MQAHPRTHGGTPKAELQRPLLKYKTPTDSLQFSLRKPRLPAWML